MPIGHIGLNTPDLEKMHKFYLAALKPLGYVQKLEFADGLVRGYGPQYCAPDFWLSSTKLAKSQDGKVDQSGTGFLHLAFSARTRNQVRAFYDAAIAAGATCNGPPGPRPQYFFTYYGAFVLDPEGRNIEAVCMKPAFWGEEWGWGLYFTLIGTLFAAAAWWFERIPL
ncbi:glyoxalase/bleomycin resistance protein/dioxygenase [Coprinopsis cinerea okayama7|uniref:Glyoxalase/bleomycin resistance protein/dioxygenase n=1 Tax=Coprinopsis cinerea (strain Okayama-7 / 130 / ATCC MYA-4618 / FGSC 9003) TaxID=240176 RepID=A8P1H8_COPC7|nr:glyoxalase/bleomycin resistance protein/dioxygenase [Coprinopsis cinerea okayama7\|eukprot:XP_001838099.1 glyoxalase/bleomycin resistance protein/dioxygenase [Coprinopsis cinerea okayama7\